MKSWLSSIVSFFVVHTLKNKQLEPEEYKAYRLESIDEIDEGYFILNARPQNMDIDHYCEIHIRAGLLTLRIIKYTIGDYIYIDVLSPTHIEVYQGEWYEESCSDGPLEYQSMKFITLEKTSKQWRPKYLELGLDFKVLFDRKVKVYEQVRSKVIANYRSALSMAITKGETCGLTTEEIDSTNLFNLLYRLFDYNPSWDGLHNLLEPRYGNAPTLRDWKEDFTKLHHKFELLKGIDVSDYALIRDHMKVEYRYSFSYILRNVKYNHKDADEIKYEALFRYLMEQLQQTSVED